MINAMYGRISGGAGGRVGGGGGVLGSMIIVVWLGMARIFFDSYKYVPFYFIRDYIYSTYIRS